MHSLLPISRSVKLAILASLGLGAAAPAFAGPAPALDCDAASLQLLVSDATVVSATLKNTSTGRSYCRVDGYITTEGPGPTPNQVKFMLSLPTAFASRYYFVGLGGSAGYVPEPPEKLLEQGYAIAGTDAGSPTPGIDWTFAWDRTKALDYAKRGVHLTTEVTQDLTNAFYGVEQRGGKYANRYAGKLGHKYREKLDKHGGKHGDRVYTYMQGCSGGGRMGQVSAMWYPSDFDGIVAAAPGLDTNNQLFFGKIAKRILDNPNAWVSPEQLKQLEALVVQQWDDADGVQDGLIWDHTVVDMDLAALGLFNPDQLETLRLITEGMDDFGQRYPGYSLANPIGWSSFLLGSTPPPWSLNPADGKLPPAAYFIFDSQSRALFGPDYDFTASFDFNDPADVNGWHNTFEQVYPGSGTAHPEDMQRFKRAGGKIIYWHGTADNGISVNGMTQFYDELARQNQGYMRTGKFARLFLVPGVLHCAGGIGPQDVDDHALDALTRWVEKGQAPRQLVANSAPGATPTRSFLLCPYPQTAVFKDRGRGADVNDASSWRCALMPRSKTDTRQQSD
ncbi:tannase/feruloyl esterase family alpha/beta hydrolase [Pseudomonas sp. NPDC077382]